MEIQVAPLPAVDRLPMPAAAGSRAGLRRFGLGALLGAFLLFQMELIVAKQILPWFGGSPAVWTTCMLFFQPCCWPDTLSFIGVPLAFPHAPRESCNLRSLLWHSCRLRWQFSFGDRRS